MMTLSTANLTLAAHAPIDLQLHTSYSDGSWTADQLLDHLIAEQFALAAITDHDRVDVAGSLQKTAVAKQFPLLVAVEMSAMWQGQLTDLLCYGFDPDNNQLDALAQDVTQRQHQNTRQVFDHLRRAGHALRPQQLEQLLAKPAAQQLPVLVALVTQLVPDKKLVGGTLRDAGFAYMTHHPAAIVEAAHRSGAVCLLAHPGRSDGFVCYDPALLDALRGEAPIDGLEVYYPAHTPAQTASYLAYAQQHQLLISAGSDSHHAAQPPITYQAGLCRALLERLGIQVEPARELK